MQQLLDILKSAASAAVSAVPAVVSGAVPDFPTPMAFRAFLIELVWSTGKAFSTAQGKMFGTIGGNPARMDTNFYDFAKHAHVQQDKSLLLKWIWAATQIDVRPSNHHVLPLALSAASMIHKLSAEQIAAEIGTMREALTAEAEATAKAEAKEAKAKAKAEAEKAKAKAKAKARK